MSSRCCSFGNYYDYYVRPAITPLASLRFRNGASDCAARFWILVQAIYKRSNLKPYTLHPKPTYSSPKITQFGLKVLFIKYPKP